MVQLVGRPRGTLTGRPIAEIVAGGPLVTEAEWQEWLAAGRFDGEVTMLHADGSGVTRAVGRDDRGRHRPAARPGRGAAHLALGPALPSRTG